MDTITKHQSCCFTKHFFVVARCLQTLFVIAADDWHSLPSFSSLFVCVYANCFSFGSMYQGLGESVVGAVPTTAAFVAMYKFLKDTTMKHVPEEFEGVLSIGAATLATVVSSFIEEPLELIKQRLQSGVSSSFKHAVRDVTHKHGMHTPQEILSLFPSMTQKEKDL